MNVHGHWPYPTVARAALIALAQLADGQAHRAPVPPALAASAAVEQTAQGSRPPLEVLERFDGLGFGFVGPQSGANAAPPRNPSDNSLAVGPNHIFQIVNSQLAVFTKKGARFDQTGTPLYGPIATNTLFVGFGGVCEARPNGDAVVRYSTRIGAFRMPGCSTR